MARLLLIAAVILFLLWAVRRALAAGRPPRAGKRPARGPELASPDRLVCGECGAQFDAEKPGWVCPHCRK
jgi:hypothetical protein